MTLAKILVVLFWTAIAAVILPAGTLLAGKPGWLGRSGGQRQESVAAGPVSREFSLLGGISRPPLMVPGGRRAAAAALRHHSRPRSPAARLGVRALCLGLAGGLHGPM